MYTLLNEAIRNRGIRKSVIARKIGVTTNTLNNKIYGVTDFSWSECCAIQKYFFPDIDKDTLFKVSKRAS